MDTRRRGPGEGLVFEPYTKEAHAWTFDWIVRHGMFGKGNMGPRPLRRLVVSLRAAE